MLCLAGGQLECRENWRAARSGPSDSCDQSFPYLRPRGHFQGEVTWSWIGMAIRNLRWTAEIKERARLEFRRSVGGGRVSAG